MHAATAHPFPVQIWKHGNWRCEGGGRETAFVNNTHRFARSGVEGERSDRINKYPPLPAMWYKADQRIHAPSIAIYIA